MSPSTKANTDSATLDVLRLLASRPELSQRELARELGISLGKSHYLVHALLNRGLVKIQNFKRSNNKLAYAYFLTPQGFGEKLRLTRAFLARKEAEFEALQITIAELEQEVQQADAGSEGLRS